MKQTVYLETSVIGALAARPSKLLDVLFMQQQTLRWWRERRHAFNLIVGDPVISEISAGDPTAARERLEYVQGLPVVRVRPEADLLATEVMIATSLPKKAKVDALHIAIAAIEGADFLLTWNCTHIANAVMRPRVESLCRSRGHEPPTICTPRELL